MNHAPAPNRFDVTFQRLTAARQGMLMPFLPLGFPSPSDTVGLCDMLVEAGADSLELGLPFSDPTADGPVLQRASEQALRNGAAYLTCLELLTAVRQRHPQVPVAVLTYANIAQTRGLQPFYQDMAHAGVDAVVLADVPAREAAPFCNAAAAAQVAPVLLAAPNTPAATLQQVAHLCRAFTYVVAATGVTGERQDMVGVDPHVLAQLRAAGAPPAVVGFGLSAPAHVARVVREGAAGAIVGSALVARLEAQAAGSAAGSVAAFVEQLKAATHLDNAALP